MSNSRLWGICGGHEDGIGNLKEKCVVKKGETRQDLHSIFQITLNKNSSFVLIKTKHSITRIETINTQTYKIFVFFSYLLQCYCL